MLSLRDTDLGVTQLPRTNNSVYEYNIWIMNSSRVIKFNYLAFNTNDYCYNTNKQQRYYFIIFTVSYLNVMKLQA